MYTCIDSETFLMLHILMLQRPLLAIKFPARRLAPGEVSTSNCADYMFLPSLGGFQLALDRADLVLKSSGSFQSSQTRG